MLIGVETVPIKNNDCQELENPVETMLMNVNQKVATPVVYSILH